MKLQKGTKVSFKSRFQRVRRFSLQKKLYLSCLLMDLALLAICTFIFYHYTTDSLRRNMHDILTGNTSLLSSQLDAMLQAGDKSLKELQTDSALLASARKITDSPRNYFLNHLPDKYTFQSCFRSLLVSQEIKGSISYLSRYYDEVGEDYAYGAHRTVGKERLQENPVLNELLDGSFYVTYAPPHQSYWKEDQLVFSVIRSMRDTHKKYGILILDYHISSITDLLNLFDPAGSYSITLVDQEGNLCYSTNADLDSEAFLTNYQRARESARDNLFSYDSDCISCFQTSPLTGWSFVLSYDTDSLRDSLQNMLFISLVLFLSLFAVTSFFLFFVTHTLTRPLQKLTAQLQALEPGENITIQEDNTSNEVATLTNSIQTFLSEIHAQNRLLMEARHRTIQAHYDAMEAQLNPHFLYNTLSVIGMTGLLSGSNTVCNMCNELASQLRYSLSYTGQPVTLEQEIANTRSYLYLMKQRYEENLQCEWEIDESLNSLSVPKLILQPLVENCFQHGFQQTECEIEPPWMIRISSYCDLERWYLSVANNGAPFHPEKLEALRQRIAHYKSLDHWMENAEHMVQRQGFGLENTVLRLNVYYYGKEFSQVSSQGAYTRITIGGPLHPEKIFNRQ